MPRMEILEILDGSIDGVVAISLFRELAESAARQLAPAPDGPTYVVMLLEWPKKTPQQYILDGSWVLPGKSGYR
jgi:hypothetical protein